MGDGVSCRTAHQWLCMKSNAQPRRRQHWQIVRAIANSASEGHLDPANIDESTFTEALSTKGMPDPELLIRTSGEARISNFLLWQLAYAELHFTPTFWPDFRKEHFFQAIIDFQDRERRFGKTSEQLLADKDE